MKRTPESYTDPVGIALGHGIAAAVLACAAIWFCHDYCWAPGLVLEKDYGLPTPDWFPTARRILAQVPTLPGALVAGVVVGWGPRLPWWVPVLRFSVGVLTIFGLGLGLFAWAPHYRAQAVMHLEWFLPIALLAAVAVSSALQCLDRWARLRS